MTAEFIQPDLMPALPEMVMLGMTCLVLVVDLFVPQEKRGITLLLSVVTLLLTICAVVLVAPATEISSFGDSGVNILVEYWMEGVDDGKNRVGADLLLMIWDAFKEHNIEIPYPQREVRIFEKT